MKDIPILLASITVLLISIFLSVFAIVEYKKYKNNQKNHTTWKKYMFAAIMCFILFCGLLTYLIIKKQVVSKHYKFGGGDRDQEDEGYVPFTLPPLWRDLSLYMNGDYFEKADGWKAESEELVEPIKPQEQLAMVLPFDSWWLIRDKRLKTIPYSAPQYWPIHHKVFSVGKKWMWECEAQIPLLVIKTLRAIGR